MKKKNKQYLVYTSPHATFLTIKFHKNTAILHYNTALHDIHLIGSSFFFAVVN